MGDTKDITKRFFDSDIITKLIVLIGIIVIAGVYIYIESLSNKQENETLVEMKKTNDNIEALLSQLIQNQGEMKVLTRCVNKAINEAKDTFDNDFTIVLGETLSSIGIKGFPQKLNQSFAKYKSKFGMIKDCLIFPEDLK